MSEELVRFSVAVPEDLLMSFDMLVGRRGESKNRSEAIRDLMRGALVEDECSYPGAHVMGTLTIVYDHHASDLQEKLDSIQHSHLDNVVSTVHVHLDHANCLEVIIMRGEAELVHDVANRILGTRGVKTGKLVVTTVADGSQSHEHGHDHAHGHSHGHGHEHSHSHEHDCD